MMVIRGINERYEIRSRSHSIGFDPASGSSPAL
jgi:hypothetical protein